MLDAILRSAVFGRPGAGRLIGALGLFISLVVPLRAAPAVLPPAAKYQPVRLDQALTNRARALAMGEKTRLTIVPTMHLVETEHFLIFTAWSVSQDAGLSALCERMFQKLAQQFSVPSTASIWIGKCPVYLFWDPAHYARFISEIDESRELDPNMAHANGYHARRGPFSYVVINGVSAFGTNPEEAKIRFYHVLVHEGTHAFMYRYVTNRPLPTWVEEGVADYIAATLVPNSVAGPRFLNAVRLGLREPEKLKEVLRKKQDLTSTEYALAESLVQFLVRLSPAATIQFIEAMKLGKSEETAFVTAYHFPRSELVPRWTLFWTRAVGKKG